MKDFESRFNAAIHSPVTSELLTHVSHQASRVIPCHPAPANSNKNTTAPITTTAVATNENESTLIPESANPQAWPPPLRTFISVVVKRSSVRAGTLFATLVFLERLQKRLERVARGMPCTCHRIFLATLIVTSKALHDASPKNKHWAKYAMWCFSLSEINLMEKQLLSILNYRLLISLEDLHHVYSCYASLRLTTPVLIPSSSSASSSTSSINYTPSLSSSIGTASNESLEEQLNITNTITNNSNNNNSSNNNSNNNNKLPPLSIVPPIQVQVQAPPPPYLLPKNNQHNHHHHHHNQVNILDEHTISHRRHL